MRIHETGKDPNRCYLEMTVNVLGDEIFPLDLPVVAHTMMHDNYQSHFNDKLISGGT